MRKVWDVIMWNLINSKNETIMKIMQQYNKLKEKHPDAILLFRSGDFYEVYMDDAKVCAKDLGITLTYAKNDNMPMAMLPHHALDIYLPKLIRAGHRIAICDLFPDPNEKKLVKRGVPPTISDDSARN